MKNIFTTKFVVITTAFFFVVSAFTNLSFVKADSADVEWAKSTVVGPATSYFYSVTTDTSGNVYAAGYISNTGQFSFGNDVTVSGGFSQNNAVVVKYNSSGEAQWAKSTVVAQALSYYYSVATDSSGNVYAAGFIYGTDQFDFGNGVTVSGGYGDKNILIVKYNSSGEAQWARSVATESGSSYYYSTATDSSGNVYAVGNIYGSGQFSFGNDVTASGGHSEGVNIIIAKYSSSGEAQWARSTVVGPAVSGFYSVTVGADNSVYAVGYITGAEQFSFGNDVTVSGGYSGGVNLLAIKYSSSGEAQWARSTVVGPSSSYLYSIATDISGNVYTAGYMYGNSQFSFGNDVTVSSGYNGNNILVLCYSSSGEAQWARSTVTAPNQSRINSISVTSSGDIYTAGFLIGNGQYDFGDSVTLNGGYTSTNALLINYYNEIIVPDPTPEDPPLDTTPPVFSDFYEGENGINILENQLISSNPYIIKTKPSDENGISKVEFYIDDNLICTDTTPDSLAFYSCDWDTSEYHSIVKIIAYDPSNNSSQIIRNTIVDPSLYLIELPKTGKQ